jgi:predicted ATPase
VLRRLGGRQAPAAAAAPVSAPFVGRARELRLLHDAFSAMKSGRPVTVAVVGGSGMGKTALVRRFLDEVKQADDDVVVLPGRCYEQESVPYKALDPVVDSLAHYLRRLPAVHSEALLPHDVLALARLFPVLRQVGTVAHARRAVLDIPDSQELRRRAFAALRELLVRLADRAPLVVCIDDLQWGDLDSASLLEALLRPPDPPALLLIGCYRSDEAATSPMLQSVLPKRAGVTTAVEARDIALEELPPDEGRELALMLLGPGGSSAVARADAIARESGGNPYFIEELARLGVLDITALEPPAADRPAGCSR